MIRFEEAWRAIPKTQQVYVAGAAGEPETMLQALRNDPELARGRRFTGVWIPGVNHCDPTAGVPDASADVFFLTAALRAGFSEGRVRHVPLSYPGIWGWFEARAREMTAVVTVTPPRDGQVGLGPTVDFTPVLVKGGARLIGEVNPDLPEPLQGYRIPVERFAALVDGQTGPVSYDAGPIDPVVETIAQTIAGMIDDGDTVQFGLGKAQAALLPKLVGHRNLGFHSGMVSTPVLEALEAGSFSKGLVTGVALGSKAFYRHICERTDIRFEPVSYTHDSTVLGGIDRLFSVASALEIDLFGQVNAEMAGGKQVSGHGGIAEFARGALASTGGRAVIALPSTAKGGTRSRIRLGLEPEVVCSIARSDVDSVVTEYGVAQLRGADVDERANALVSVAHPDFRDGLADGWSRVRRRM